MLPSYLLFGLDDNDVSLLFQKGNNDDDDAFGLIALFIDELRLTGQLGIPVSPISDWTDVVVVFSVIVSLFLQLPV